MQIARVSSLTGMSHVRDINITVEEYLAWENAGDNDDKRFIQNAFPRLSAGDREYIKTGITPAEWNDAFGGDFDSDYDD